MQYDVCVQETIPCGQKNLFNLINVTRNVQ